MTVFNGGEYLSETVESVLGQTYEEFCFLIIDNASTDSSRDIIRSYNDPRIHLVELPQNIGQVRALNHGLHLVQTPLIARMDADDICMPQRLQQQVEFMENNPRIGICGTYAIAFRGQKEEPWTYPTDPDRIKIKLLFECPLVHPSVIMRKDLLDQHQLKYDETIGHSYDWDLWQRASQHTHIANIPQYLLRYRLHNASESQRTRELQEHAAQHIDHNNLTHLHLQNHPLRHIHRDICFETYNARNREKEFLQNLTQWFQQLQTANQQHRVYNPQTLRSFLKERLFIALTANTQHRKQVLRLYRQEKLHHHVPRTWRLKFFLKLILPFLARMGGKKL